MLDPTAAVTDLAIPVWDGVTGRQLKNSPLVTSVPVPTILDPTPQGWDVDGVHDLTMYGKFTCYGLIDPPGVEFDISPSNPGLHPERTIWLSSLGVLTYGETAMLLGSQTDKKTIGSLAVWASNNTLSSAPISIREDSLCVENLVQKRSAGVSVDETEYSQYALQDSDTAVFTFGGKSYRARFDGSFTSTLTAGDETKTVEIKYITLGNEVHLHIPLLSVASATEVEMTIPQELQTEETSSTAWCFSGTNDFQAQCIVGSVLKIRGQFSNGKIKKQTLIYHL
jgi:hypothetical protein